jgi:hypothetical protein
MVEPPAEPRQYAGPNVAWPPGPTDVDVPLSVIEPRNGERGYWSTVPEPPVRSRSAF